MSTPKSLSEIIQATHPNTKLNEHFSILKLNYKLQFVEVEHYDKLKQVAVILAKAAEFIEGLDKNPYNHHKNADNCSICKAKDAIAQAKEIMGVKG